MNYFKYKFSVLYMVLGHVSTDRHIRVFITIHLTAKYIYRCTIYIHISKGLGLIHYHCILYSDSLCLVSIEGLKAEPITFIFDKHELSALLWV